MHYLDMFSQPEVTLLADVIEVGVLVFICVCAYVYDCTVCVCALCVCVRCVCVSICVYVHVFLPNVLNGQDVKKKKFVLMLYRFFSLRLQYLLARNRPFHPESVANDCKVS